MSKGQCTFRKSDVKRMLVAAESAGVKVARVEVQAGKIILVPRDDAADPAPTSEWEDVR